MDKENEGWENISDLELLKQSRARYAGQRQAFEQRFGPPRDYLNRAAEERSAALSLFEAYQSREAGAPDSSRTPGSVHEQYEARIGEGSFLHLRTVTKLLLVDAVGLFFAFGTPTGFPLLFGAWFGMSAVDLLRNFVKCYERLKDPDELKVFETIYELHNFRVAEREARGEELAMFDQIRIPEADLIAWLGPTMPAEKARAALKELESREILSQNKEGWAIRFW